MWLQHRNPKLPRRTRRQLLLVEQLEKRELLSGSPQPTSPLGPHSTNQPPALPGPLPEIPAYALLPGHTLPGGAQQLVGNVPGPAWQVGPQSPTGLFAPGAPPQKTPANAKAPHFQIPLVVGPNQSSTPAGEGYTPAQLQQAYGFNQIALPAGETFNDAGSGQTIAIIDGLDDPYIASDLQQFDKTFNIGGAAHDPTNTSFLKVVNEYGGSTLPPTDNGQVDYGLETSLDVEWAHAMAPGANILLVETSTPFSLNDLDTAIEFAARQPNVSVVSMSFGAGDFTTEYYFDNIFTTPAGHAGVSFVASAGDGGGFFLEYPAMSPNVLSVGGTTLPPDASGNPDRAQEFAWSNGGGGISQGEAEPAYQTGVQSTGFRTSPDLAYDADPNTGVAIVDTLFANANSPGKPWLEIGGTSMGAPQISSLVAITNQLRVAQHEGTLDGPNQLLPAVYQIAATDPRAFQDITSGNNGYPAGPGYDFATGFGTPHAQYLVPDLVAVDPKPAAPATLYWTGDVDNNWNTPGNWSTVDPAVTNVQQSVLPTSNDRVVVDLSGVTILHDAANYDTISSLTVTAPKVTLDLGAGTLDLSGGGGRGTFQVDQPGDAVTAEAGVLAHADVTSGTTLSATSPASLFFTAYPELADVQLDGTVNANQSGQNNGFQFTGGLVLNGTINLGGTSDQSSVLLAGYFDSFDGNNLDNNPETISGTGTIQLGQSQNGDAIYNWGTLGTFTIGPGITVRGGGPGSIGLFEQTANTGGLDNQGTIDANGGTFVIQAFGPVSSGGGPATAWTNEGTIETTGTTLGLLGGWINYGTIRADSAPTVLLGSNTFGDVPGSPFAPFETWSSQGSLVIGDGATVYVGGFLTTDQYQGAAGIPGVSIDPARDSLFLDGTLDNSAADNAVSRGVLALNATTGPLEMVGGTVNGGSIVTSGSDDIEVSIASPLPTIQVAQNFTGITVSGGWMSNLTNDGTVNATGVSLTLTNVTSDGTVSGASATVEELGAWANYGTIRVDSASSLYLGSPIDSIGFLDPTNPPTLAEGSPYAWDLSTVGAIAVADGATLGLGGLMTSDQFAAFPTLPGVSIDLAQDTVLLDGWLDNLPADNPVHGVILALTSATGVVTLKGGLIAGGTITSSGAGALDVAFGFMDGVTNDGAISALTQYSPLFLEGNTVNNGTLTASGAQIVSLPEGSFINNGSLVALSGGSAFFQGNVTNNGTFTATEGGFGVAAAGSAVSLTNAGTIAVSSGNLFVQGSLTNAGTVSISNGSGATFYGTYDNTHGTISVDSTSGMTLGFTTLLEVNFPTFADGKPYAFDPSKVGKVTIADGGFFGIGGLMTTDQFNALPTLPGVSVHLAEDRVELTGWLDNSPADNPKSHGVLAVTAATGPLFLDGCYIYQGKVVTNGADDLESFLNILDGVELDGNLHIGPIYGFGQAYAVNNLTLNGTIDVEGLLYAGFFDNATDTIGGTGAIVMGTSQTYQSVVVDLSNKSLTIGRGITIDAGAQFADLVSEGSQINVQGTVVDDTATSTLYTYGVDHNTGAMFQDLANLNGGTLTGGTWEFSNGATWRTDAADITANAANLSLSGAGTQILDAIFDPGNNALAGFTTNTASGTFTVGPGYNFTASTFSNAGVVNVGGTFAVQGNYTQSATGTLGIDIAGPAAYGTVTVGGTANLAGTLNVVLVNGYVPAPGTAFTVLTFGARSGDFGTENGLVVNKDRLFVSAYLGNSLTLVVGPGVSVVAGTDLFIIGGLTSNDQIQIKPVGSSNTGSTGVQVTATLNGVSTTVSFSQAFSTIYVFGFAGNDSINLASTLTISASISAGNGNDNVTVGNGNDTVTVGNGNDNVTAGSGNNTVTVGNGNDNTRVGNGNNVVVEGNGNDNITAGNGNNLIAAGLGHHTVQAGNGNNILIDGSVRLTQSGDSLRQVLNDWIQYGATAANVASIRSRLAVTYNTSHANTLTAGSGLDWFWFTYGKDSTNRKRTDLLN